MAELPVGVAVRRFSRDDRPFLREMLYQSLHVRAGALPFPRSVLENADIAHYLHNFGDRDGDDGHVAVGPGGAPIGAAWCRRLTSQDPGYGYVDDKTPELGMAVEPGWRGRGIGRRLLQDLLARNPAMSLSVDAENVGALALYVSLGFVDIATVDGSITMYRAGEPSSGR